MATVFNEWRSALRYFAISVCIIFVSGCTKPDLPFSLKAPSPSSLGDSLVRVENPRERKKFYNWLIREMYEQIYVRKPAPGQILSWSNVLSQGGSVEGIYHGMVLSGEYRGLEVGNASAAAVRFFANEAVALQDKGQRIAMAPEALAKRAMNLPLFTLKRELGERMLAALVKHEHDRAELAAFYATTAARWANSGVDFGLRQRNSRNEAFHYKWAMSSSFGLIQWELLNRMHRIFNHLGEISLGGI